MTLANAFDQPFLQNLAWTLTVLSAVLSIVLSMRRFGMSPGKRIMAIIGLIIFGVAVAVLVISDLSPFKSLSFITSGQAEQIRDAHNKDGNHSTGYEITDKGVTENTASGELNRVSDFIYGVIQPNGAIVAVYNGGFFDAEIDGKTVNCELIDIGDDRVLIIKGGEQIETIKLNSSQSENTFKVQKVPVSKKPGS